ncbi:regulatory protein GemA [Pseudomonas stutzeri]|jgi:phage gp16-like protein|uniref:gp16 family protein n=1 Tax=Stutzerimonas stutzeri group TaxID=136846 RepID=UPI0005B34504|nr:MULTISPECIES: regulatory protein GemA [Stutzerimonas stutzeri group]MCC8341592.1 regulatory protein GemA [Stutzerimonas stutzeri]
MSLAKIHIAKAQLGLDDDTYRALLARVAGVRSAKDLNRRQVGLVIAEFQRLGWQPAPARKAGRQPKPTPDRKALIGKIEAFLAEAERPWAYADAMALRMFKVERVEWLDSGQLQRLVAAFAYDAERHGRPT